jgi:hypothetical protein
MGLFAISENISFIFNCFRPTSFKKPNRKRHAPQGVNVDVGDNYNIITLPVMTGRDIADLYPPTNHVEDWSILIVGKQKNYILAHLNDLHVPNADCLPNNTGDRFLPKEVNSYFNQVWDKTLAGNELQFYMVMNGKTYFVNTYRFVNRSSETVGAIMFLRQIDLMPNLSFNEARRSLDIVAFDHH